MRRLGAVLVAIGLLAGCGSGQAPPPEPERITWRAVGLPADPGGAVMLRDAVWCPGVWFAVGALRDPSGGTRPAAWTSPDGVSWSALRLAARTFYGRQNVLSTAACRDGRLVAVGAKVGGAHGNPRTSSWSQSADGVLREVVAPFELFGGPQAVKVSRLAGGPAGFLIAGNRMSGAAVWSSPDGARFELHERSPVLASDRGGETWAFDGTAVSDGWLVVGGFLPAGRVDRDPVGWRSVDGVAWRRVDAVGPTSAYEELQRVTVLNGVPVAVGLAGPVFRAWRLEGERWRPAGSLGAVPAGGGSSVRSVAAVGGRLWAVTSDRAAYALWVSDDRGDSWRPASLPAVVATPVAESAVVVSASGAGRVVLISDDTRAGRIYLAETGM